MVIAAGGAGMFGTEELPEKASDSLDALPCLRNETTDAFVASSFQAPTAGTKEAGITVCDLQSDHHLINSLMYALSCSSVRSVVSPRT